MGIGSSSSSSEIVANAPGTDDSDIVAPPRANGSSYDVFLSFRGEDTRYAFADHLYDALVGAGLRAFRDDDEIDRGQVLKPELETAIKSSDASIIILSKNYATSTWCLDELWMILEQRRIYKHFVLPVFYHVDPSDVRKQNNTFKVEVKTSSTRWTYENVKRWKGALTRVADLTGIVVSGYETQVFKKIVDTLYKKLNRKQVDLPANLTGMTVRAQKINKWITQSDAEFLVIWGMGGSGKSTLARYIVYSNWQSFENISVLEDINSKCKKLHRLQEQLYNDISGGKNRKIPSVRRGTFQIEEMLQTRKALIVLDDIVKPSQLTKLLGFGNINKQSKIIITTTKRDLSYWLGFNSRRYAEYKMELLHSDEALELLCLHAFGSKIPMEGYEKLAKQVVRYCEGNPLGLETLGSTLAEYNSTTEWESVLKLFGKDIHCDINIVLKRSYDSLPFDADRELFLHIACFFVGMDLDYVTKILEPDYSAASGIKTLIKRCLVYVTPNKSIMMHRLLQEMGRMLVDRESSITAQRSRVWRNIDSYKVLVQGKYSEKIIGLALDVHALMKEDEANYELIPKPSRHIEIDSRVLKEMDQLKLLRLNFVSHIQFREEFAQHLRWLCCAGCDDIYGHFLNYMGSNMVVLDMSYSSLLVFEPPVMVLQSLKILNLKSSKHLREIRNIFRLPNLETLVLWNCHRLHHVCGTIEQLKRLALLNLTGCEKLNRSFSLPHSLERLFLKDCNLECTDDFPLTFVHQSGLQYLNLGNSLFELLPSYTHLKNLRVLDLSLCSKLKLLLCLPSTLAELYIYYCVSLEMVTFESGQFTLQEIGYEGCSNLSEIEGLIKLVPVAKLDEDDLGHMKWLKHYQNVELCLAGDDELMRGRCCQLQVLYEFNIMSTSLPNIQDPNMMPEYTSESTWLSFVVPSCRKKRRLKGLNVTFKYTISGDDNDDWVWFTKIRSNNGVDLMYNPKVFGKPASGEVGIWLSYWPIGNKLNVGDSITVSILEMKNGLEIHGCGASLVYTDNDEPESEKRAWVEGDLAGFQLSSSAYYLCRRDFFQLMEVDRLTPGWLSILIGDPIDDTEVRGWRKTGRPQQPHQIYTELKFVRCIVYGPQSFILVSELETLAANIRRRPLPLPETAATVGAQTAAITAAVHLCRNKSAPASPAVAAILPPLAAAAGSR